MKSQNELNLLEDIKKIDGKFRLTHASSYDGRRQTIAVIKTGGEYYQGSSQCCKTDKFSRRTGREIALGRAFKAFIDGKPTPKECLGYLLLNEDLCANCREPVLGDKIPSQWNNQFFCSDMCKRAKVK